jgi:hypothetical protein
LNLIEYSSLAKKLKLAIQFCCADLIEKRSDIRVQQGALPAATPLAAALLALVWAFCQISSLWLVLGHLGNIVVRFFLWFSRLRGSLCSDAGAFGLERAVVAC